MMPAFERSLAHWGDARRRRMRQFRTSYHAMILMRESNARSALLKSIFSLYCDFFSIASEELRFSAAILNARIRTVASN